MNWLSLFALTSAFYIPSVPIFWKRRLWLEAIVWTIKFFVGFYRAINTFGLTTWFVLTPLNTQFLDNVLMTFIFIDLWIISCPWFYFKPFSQKKFDKYTESVNALAKLHSKKIFLMFYINLANLMTWFVINLHVDFFSTHPKRLIGLLVILIYSFTWLTLISLTKLTSNNKNIGEALKDHLKDSLQPGGKTIIPAILILMTMVYTICLFVVPGGSQYITRSCMDFMYLLVVFLVYTYQKVEKKSPK